MTTNIYNDKKP